MITEKFKEVILKELNLDECNIEENTTANEIPGWDSLNHINVILAIENAFNIKFNGYEVLKCKNIGDLNQLVEKKLGESHNQ